MNRLQDLLESGLSRRQEKEVIQFLETTSSVQLNSALQSISIRRLFDEVVNHWTGGKNRDQLLQLLTVDRISDIDVVNRCRIIRALQY